MINEISGDVGQRSQHQLAPNFVCSILSTAQALPKSRMPHRRLSGRAAGLACSAVYGIGEKIGGRRPLFT